MANLQITSTQSNNIVVTVNRGIAGVGIESISVVYNAPTYYLNFLYTDGTNELVALPAIASGVSSFNTRAGAVTLTSLDVTTALGYTPPTPTGTGATGTWTISINGNASTVTNGVYTTDTGTVTNAMLAGSIANAKLVNSAITINGSPTSLGGSVNVGTVTSVSGTAPIVSTGGAAPSISMPQANTAQDGYLSAVDWDTFNDKTSNLGTVTSVSGTGNVNGITLTGNITDSGSLTLGGSLSSVDLVTQTVGSLDVSTRATGLLPIANGGTNASTASTARTNLGLGTSAVLNAAVALGTATLDSGGTVPLTQLPASIKAGLVYKGTWNASTNTPTLTSSVGTANDYYVVSVAGTTNLNGVNVWAVNDLAIFNGTVWQKVSASNPTIITANSTTDALRVTQLGTGNALLVEDSANPDSTPVVINGDGEVVLGATTAQTSNSGLLPKLQLHGLSNNNSTFAITDWRNNGFAGPFVNYNKSKGGAVGTRGIVASNDRLGFMTWSGDDGAAFIGAAQIEAYVDGTPGTNDMPGRLVFSTTADGASSPTERMRISSSGVVAIGSTVTAGGASGCSIRFGNNLTGATNPQSIVGTPTVLSDATAGATIYTSIPSTQAAAFTCGSLNHYVAVQGTFGAGSTVTNQFGYSANASLVGATNNYGFYGNIPAGTGRWNFYAAGTAANYFAGETTVNSGLTIGRTAVTAPAASDGNVFSGTYTPTLTNTTNVSSSTAVACQYMRVGNMVTVSGSLLVSPTAALGTFTALGISLPVASALTTDGQVAGTAAFISGTAANSAYGRIAGDAANDTAVLNFNANSTGSSGFYFSFTYRVI